MNAIGCIHMMFGYGVLHRVYMEVGEYTFGCTMRNVQGVMRPNSLHGHELIHVADKITIWWSA